MQIVGEVAGGGEGVRVVVAQDAAPPGEGVLVPTFSAAPAIGARPPRSRAPPACRWIMQVWPRRAATALPDPAAKTIDQIRPIRTPSPTSFASSSPNWPGRGQRHVVNRRVDASCLFIFEAGGAGGARGCRVAGWTEVAQHRLAGRCEHPGWSDGRLWGAHHGRGACRAGCARPGAGMTRLVPDGLLGCPPGSSPVLFFAVMLVP